jgi:hypothetical protein
MMAPARLARAALRAISPSEVLAETVEASAEPVKLEGKEIPATRPERSKRRSIMARTIADPRRREVAFLIAKLAFFGTYFKYYDEIR